MAEISNNNFKHRDCDPTIYDGHTLLSKGQEFMTKEKIELCYCINQPFCIRIAESLNRNDLFHAMGLANYLKH